MLPRGPSALPGVSVGISNLKPQLEKPGRGVSFGEEQQDSVWAQDGMGAPVPAGVQDGALVWRCCDCPIPEGIQLGWDPAQPHLVPDLAVGNPSHGRSLETDNL